MKRILFVTKGCDPVLFRVNIGWIAAAMDRRRFVIGIVDCANQDVSGWIRDYDLILYYRILDIANTGLGVARSLGKVTGYVIDDYLLGFPEASQLVGLMQQMNFVVTTTPLLKDLYQDAGVQKPFFVKRHGLPIDKFLDLRRPQPRSPMFRLGWLGGLTHSTFAQMVCELLQAVSGELMSLTLVCFGKPEWFVEAVQRIPNIQIENLPFVPFTDEAGYYAAIANANLDLALNMLSKDLLSYGKSELKYLEAGLYGLPLLTTRYGFFPHVIVDKQNGLLADGIDEFVQKIRLIKNNPALGRQIGKLAQVDVIQNCNIEKRALEFGNYLESI